MLFTDITVARSENYIKYINTICGHYFEFLTVQRAGTFGTAGPQRSCNKSNPYDNNNTQGRFAQHKRQT